MTFHSEIHTVFELNRIKLNSAVSNSAEDSSVVIQLNSVQVLFSSNSLDAIKLKILLTIVFFKPQLCKPKASLDGKDQTGEQ